MVSRHSHFALGTAILAFAVVFVAGIREGADCRNHIPDCSAYEKTDICHPGRYPDWTKKNCEEFCGLCKRTTPCTDNIDTCYKYDHKVACYGEYIPWAIQNCEKTCKFCQGAPTPPVPTLPPVPTPTLPPTVPTPVVPTVPTGSSVSEKDKEIIIGLINDYRAKVQPAAKAMPTVIWDSNLAKLCQTWTDKCTYGVGPHDTVYGSTWNKGAGYGSWRGAVEGWHAPVKIFQYGKDPDSYLGPGGWVKIGTYTQLIDSDMVRLGCGYSACGGGGNRLYICMFVKGQLTGKATRPYDSGDRCSSCPRTCKDGLCDCGGLLCYGSKRLDVNACTCV